MKYLTTFIFFLFLFTACDDTTNAKCADGACNEVKCTPDCTDKVCGSDGCGGTCGSCESNERCSDAGTCEKKCFDKLSSDTTFNINLETVKVSGKITLNGKQMPDSTLEDSNRDNQRGYIEFKRKGAKKSITTEIGATGEATYYTEIYKGEYSIRFWPYNSYAQNVLPYISILLNDSVFIDKDTRFDFNLETALLSGRVTLNGKTIPDNTMPNHEIQNRASISIEREDPMNDDPYNTNNVAFSIGAKGEATYSVYLFKGSYKVELIASYYRWQNVFNQDKTLIEKITVEKNTIKDFDIETVKLNGEITINNKTMPDNTLENCDDQARAQIRFKAKGSDKYLDVIIGGRGAAKYSTTINKGTYDIFLDSNGGRYQNSIPDCQIKLAENVTIEENETLNFNLDTVTLRGEITLNGKQMPDNTDGEYGYKSRGTIKIRNKETDDFNNYTPVEISAKGKATYEITLYKGTYKITLKPNVYFMQNVLIPYETLLDKEIELKESMEKNYNLETVKVKGEIKLNGKQMPDNSNPDSENQTRGIVTFKDNDTLDSYAISVVPTGPAYYEGKIYKGNYNLKYSLFNITYNDMPLSYSAPIEDNIEITSDTVKSFNVETALLKGAVTLNGEQLPDNTSKEDSDRPRGTFTIKGKHEEYILEYSLNNTGAFTYEVLLPKASYEIGIHPGAYYLQNVLPETDIIYTTCEDKTETLQ